MKKRAFMIMFSSVLATILALTIRSGDKNSLQLVLFSLALFHSLSFFSNNHRQIQIFYLTFVVLLRFNMVS